MVGNPVLAADGKALAVDPSLRTVTIYRALDDIRILEGKAGETLDGVDVVPGWRLPVAELFS